MGSVVGLDGWACLLSLPFQLASPLHCERTHGQRTICPLFLCTLTPLRSLLLPSCLESVLPPAGGTTAGRGTVVGRLWDEEVPFPERAKRG